MVRRRHQRNPTKVKIDVRSLDQAPPEEVFDRWLALRRRLTVALLSLLTVVLLSMSFAPFDYWPVAYVAMAPWILALVGGTGRRWALLWAWLAGLLFWAANLYWLWWITLVGYFPLVLYLSAYWLAAAAIVRAGVRRNRPMWAVFPVVWVALEYARAHVISGFPWFFLAHSQYAQTRLIQVADLTGQYGVSFFVAMVNGAIADVLIHLSAARAGRGPWVTRKAVVALGAAVGAAGVLLAYGSWRLNQDTRQEGPVIGIVQCAFRNTLTGRESPEQDILRAHLEIADGLAGQGCDLVIVPETMLPAGLNSEFLMVDLKGMDDRHLRRLGMMFFGDDAKDAPGDDLRILLARWIEEGILTKADLKTLDGAALRRLAENFWVHFDEAATDESLRAALADVRRKLQREGADGKIVSRSDYAVKVGQASGRLGCPILAGGVTWHSNPRPMFGGDEWLFQNSALWFDRTWQAATTYSKMHLVPFSEYVPFKHSWPWLFRRLKAFVPDVMSQLEPGAAPSRFELKTSSGAWQLVTPICYEGTFARLCRRLVRGGPKDKLIMANLSNDGWFVWRSSDGVNRASHEHSQHLASYCFRAVEGRVPVIRAVNTGISGSIDSNGRIVAVLENHGRREMASGSLVLDGARKGSKEFLAGHGPKVLVDRRVSYYSRIGDVFAMTVGFAAMVFTAWIVMIGLRENKGRT